MTNLYAYISFFRNIKASFISYVSLFVYCLFSTLITLPVLADVIFVVDAPNSQTPVRQWHQGQQPYTNPVSQTFDLSINGSSASALSGTLAVNSSSYWYETNAISSNFNDDYMGELEAVGNTATWTVNGYNPGENIEIYATWREQSNYSTSAPYVLNGTTTTNINHRLAATADLVLADPAGGTEAFQLLGSANADGSGQVQVVLSRGTTWTPVDALAFKSAANTPQPLVEYRFEEKSWNGSTDEIKDYSGNDHHARVNNNSTPETLLPALTGNPGTCGYASQNDGSIQVTGLPLDTTTIGVKTTVTFWMNWDGTNSVMPIGWNVHDIWIVSGSIGFNTGRGDVFGVSSAGLANGWHHIAVEFTNGSVTSNRMHIDGVEQVLTQRRSTPNNNQAYVNSEMRMGGWKVNAGYDFHGSLDEFKVFQEALTTAQINSVMAQRHPCPAIPVAEYRFDELVWDGTADEVIDTLGNINYGTAIGDTETILAGQICRAGTFDGTGDYIDINGIDTYLKSTASLSFWIKTNRNGNNTAWLAPGILGVEERGGGADIFWGFIDSSGHIRIQKGNGNAASSSTLINDDSWHHVVLTWDSASGAVQAYVDGVLEDSAISDSGDVTTAFSSIGRIDNSFSNINFTGQLDELLIFDSVVTASDVSAIYNNQLNGKNYNGTTRICPVPAVKIAEYRFEEDSWNGTPEEVIDYSGNDYHGRLHNNSTPDTTLPALTGNPGTCGYASQNDGAIQITGLPLDTTTVGVKTTVAFWMNWDGTNNVMPIGWYIHDIWMVNGAIGFNTGAGDLFGVSSAGLANGWHHVVVEFTNGSVTNNRMYIDGVEQVLTQIRNTPNNSRAYVDSELRIGGWRINSGYDFHGLIDEVQVFEGVLTTAEVLAIMAERHSCSSTPDHYEIQHDGIGLTCDTETVIIKACADASCTTLSDEVVTLDFLADGVLISSETFTGSTSVNFNHTNVETLSFSVANESVAALNSYICNDGVGNSCDMVFSDAGFKFLYGAGNSATVPHQTAGLVFGDTLKVQAVKDIDGVCTGLFSGDKSIDLSQENIIPDPGGNTGLHLTINGNSIAKHTSSTSATLNFGANSIAVIPNPIYHDAGEIRLHANYNVGGVTLTGNSNSFWVSPAELVINAKSAGVNLDGASATATPTHKAGEDFELSVTAYNGAIPQVITPNYLPGQIALTLTRTAPTLATSVEGQLTFAPASVLTTNTRQDVTLTSFSAGISSYNAAQYSEVGLINVDVEDRNYGNVGIVIEADDLNIGRFIPDHFTQTVVEHGSFMATCNTGTTFAYSGQKDEATDSIGAISYLANPILAITARNKQGNITQNYYEDSQGSANDYMKLIDTDVTITSPTTDRVAIGADNNPLNLLPLTANMNTGVLSQNDLTQLPNVVPLPKGVLHYQFSNADNFFYNRTSNAIVAPFMADIDFTTASILDIDAVDLTPSLGASTTEIASPVGVEIRFGRLRLENSFGPETANLPQPIQIEHFDGTGFIVTSNNNCVTYDASKLSLTNNGLNPALTSILGGTGSFVSGKTRNIELRAPGANNRGQIGTTYNTYDWLKFDWDNNGTFDDPTAIATFGQFRGNDRIIYWREVAN